MSDRDHVPNPYFLLHSPRLIAPGSLNKVNLLVEMNPRCVQILVDFLNEIEIDAEDHPSLPALRGNLERWWNDHLYREANRRSRLVEAEGQPA